MSRKTAMDQVFTVKLPRKEPAAQDALEASIAKGVAPSLEASNPPALTPRPRSGAVGAMGATLEKLASRAEAAENIEAGSAIVALDPALIDSSFVSDRLSDAADPSFDGLVDSIRESGQQVPILVRPHPKISGRYQIAYGHRRARAAAKLGVRVRAVVRQLTDAELVVAQGKENLERQDLSYIERAFFARRLEEMSFPRDVISSAMGVHKPDVSNFIMVARMVPEDIVAAIGPAPKAGGPRWKAIAGLIKQRGREPLDGLIRQPGFSDKATDDRFSAALDAFASGKPAGTQVWKDETGRAVAHYERGARRFAISVDEKAEPGLGEFIVSQLPHILAAHRARKD